MQTITLKRNLLHLIEDYLKENGEEYTLIRWQNKNKEMVHPFSKQHYNGNLDSIATWDFEECMKNLAESVYGQTTYDEEMYQEWVWCCNH